MGLFKVTVSGFETVENDLEKEQKQIEKASVEGLRMVESQFYADLERHIQKDWYEAWGEPKQYERRTDDPSLGPPLGDFSNMNSEIKGLTLTFDYFPSGKHSNGEWNNHNGDEIIKIIQMNEGWSYPVNEDRQKRMIMPRPFWNNFVEEEFNGQAFAVFDYGFSGRGYDLIPEGVGKDLEYTSGESLLDAAEDFDLPL